MYDLFRCYFRNLSFSILQKGKRVKRLRQNLPAVPEAKGVVVAWFWVVKSLGRFFEYIGRFWCSERVGWCRCKQQWLVILLRWREFDTRVAEREHAMEHGLRKQNNNGRLFLLSICPSLHSKVRETTNVACSVAQFNIWTQIICLIRNSQF